MNNEAILRASRGARIDNALDEIVARFPVAFDKDKPKPLALGIHRDVADACADIMSRTTARRAVRKWCGQYEYQRSLTQPQAAPVDLTGGPVGEVTGEQQAFAGTVLKRLREEKPVRSKLFTAPKVRHKGGTLSIKKREGAGNA